MTNQPLIRPLYRCLLAAAIHAGGSAFPLHAQSNWTVIGWNNLGMHCMDSDYSVFSILPPYNTFHAQVIDASGDLVTDPGAAGIGVGYHAVADLNGSLNRTSRDKSNFWQYDQALFGIDLPENTGLPVPGPEMFHMPGTNNEPQGMRFETGLNWFAAHGVPIAPYDDNDKPNQYPMMRLTVTNNAGHVLAMTDIVLPVSDEMDCKLCHASGSGPDAEPTAGWVWDSDPGRDYRLNILRMHDELQLGSSTYSNALAAHGFHPGGLLPTVTENERPILCASCHLSEALPGSGIEGIPPLTEAMHSRHAVVIDPRNNMALDADANRQACYTCHPGSETRCLRGAMGRAVASDGSMLMQCQSCHGGMAEVGSPTRTGWLDEPNCQACHVGSATNSFGLIRFVDAFTNGSLRVPHEDMFATNPDTPAPGHSLYRYSAGHGGLQCSACHGSTHAIYPTALPNDNVSMAQIQGHAGTLNECTSCHASMPNTRNGGPHGMHTIGQAWINDHNDAAQQLGANSCRTCHGQNGEGSVLSLAFSAKSLTSEKGNVTYFKGQKVTCWGCHNGMFESDPTSKGVPTVSDVHAVTTSGIPVAITLNGSNLRIIDQPRRGQVALAGGIATYYPDSAFAGEDRFTFAANNGFNDSNLGTTTIRVEPHPDGLAPPEPAAIFAFGTATNDDLAFVSRLGGAYRLEAATSLTQQAWTEVVSPVWGRTDVTRVPNQAVFTYMQMFRVVSIDAPAAPTPSTDRAADPAYDAGWLDASNGGVGFSNWVLNVTGGSGGHFIADTNAPDLNAGVRSWGLWANSGSLAEAIRSFATPLNDGDAVILHVENNYVDTGNRVGIDFLNASGIPLVRWQFTGGDDVYQVEDFAGLRDTFIPWSNLGWDVSLRITGDSDYLLSCGDHHIPGILVSHADRRVAAIRLWNDNAGSGSDHDLYISDLMVQTP